jgi:acetyltransferase
MEQPVVAIDAEQARRIVERARADGRSVLDESESLDLLDVCGIPTCSRQRVEVVAGKTGLREAAARLGPRVVIKGIVAGVSHKTGSGLVHAGFGDVQDVDRAADAIAEAGGDRLRAFLVQAHVDSVRELACGLVRDASFGPSVMVGFGGVHAELVHDTSLRVAPLGGGDAGAMLAELRTTDLLGPYRGAAPADTAAIGRILVALGDLGLAVDELSELDVNPLMITSGGAPVAVDALAVVSH